MCGTGAFVESIEIDVVELQTAGVRIYKCERRTRDVFFSNTQRGADALHEDRLACAEWTTEQKNLASFKTRARLVPEVESLFRR